MPRVSIIVAHQQDQRLEDTLLSILESRPRDCEIIVAHDGSYSDPYHLADEVLFVETDASCSLTSKLNEGLYAACSPVVHLLAEGVKVTEGWCENASHWIMRHGCVAVSPLVEVAGRGIFAGLDARRLATRSPQKVKQGQATQACAGPMLAAGFYSRKWLLAVGGLMESVDPSVADVDLALTLADLGQTCQVDCGSLVVSPETILKPNHRAGLAGDLASVLAAHHQLPPGVMSGIKSGGLRLLSNIINPSQWAPALAWGMGLASNKLEAEVADRLASYRKSQQPASEGSAARRAA